MATFKTIHTRAGLIAMASAEATGTTKTVSAWRMPDDLHLHSDTTGVETTLMAQQIAPWLAAQR